MQKPLFRPFKAALALGLVALSFSAQATDFMSCLHHFANHTPPAQLAPLPKDQRALCFDGFAVLYSGESKTAVYSAEHFTYEKLKKAPSIKRTNRFYEEARLPSRYRANLKDYVKSGFDRGHLFPAGNAASDEAMAQSFSLANIVPQNPSHNRGPWARSVERAVRQYVDRTQSDVYIVTGPIYDSKTPKKLGEAQTWIPDHLFKFIYDPNVHQAWGYILKNDAQSKVQGIYSYEEMVAKTGLSFLP